MAEYVREKSGNMPGLTAEHNPENVAKMNEFLDFLILNDLKGIMYEMKIFSTTNMIFIIRYFSFDF